MGDLQQKLCSLEGVLALKTEADLKYQAEMEMKHQEVSVDIWIKTFRKANRLYA